VGYLTKGNAFIKLDEKGKVKQSFSVKLKGFQVSFKVEKPYASGSVVN